MRSGRRAEWGCELLREALIFAKFILEPLAAAPPCHRIAAHGKKLNKGKVLQVHVGETWYVVWASTRAMHRRFQCVLRKTTTPMTPQASIPIRSEVLMNPEVPQALRLQAVLAGGVVVIQHRQVTYLLDDCNDALVSLSKNWRTE